MGIERISEDDLRKHAQAVLGKHSTVSEYMVGLLRAFCKSIGIEVLDPTPAKPVPLSRRQFFEQMENKAEIRFRDRTWKIHGVHLGTVCLQNTTACEVYYATPQELVDQATWEENGSPCGTLQS